ncbi:unnamed protein product [Rhodiola kirilowii]
MLCSSARLFCNRNLFGSLKSSPLALASGICSVSKARSVQFPSIWTGNSVAVVGDSKRRSLIGSVSRDGRRNEIFVGHKNFF